MPHKSAGLMRSIRSRSVMLAIGIAMSACNEATGPDSVRDTLLLERRIPSLRDVTLFGGSVTDAAQRVVPTMPNEMLAWWLGVALADLANALDQFSWTRTESALARSLRALELCEKVQGLERSAAAELEVIRLSLLAIDQIVPASANTAATER